MVVVVDIVCGCSGGNSSSIGGGGGIYNKRRRSCVIHVFSDCKIF